MASHLARFLCGLAAALALLGISAHAQVPSDVTEWAVATPKESTGPRVLTFRYAKAFRAGFDRAAYPQRVILGWRYASTAGMPVKAELDAMNRMEDLLAPAVQAPDVAVLVLVSTGENLREWTYYAKSEDEFLRLMNAALKAAPRFSIEIRTAADPEWSTYGEFRKGLRE